MINKYWVRNRVQFCEKVKTRQCVRERRVGGSRGKNEYFRQGGQEGHSKAVTF